MVARKAQKQSSPVLLPLSSDVQQSAKALAADSSDKQSNIQSEQDGLVGRSAADNERRKRAGRTKRYSKDPIAVEALELAVNTRIEQDRFAGQPGVLRDGKKKAWGSKQTSTKCPAPSLKQDASHEPSDMLQSTEALTVAPPNIPWPTLAEQDGVAGGSADNQGRRKKTRHKKQHSRPPKSAGCPLPGLEQDILRGSNSLQLSAKALTVEPPEIPWPTQAEQDGVAGQPSGDQDRQRKTMGMGDGQKKASRKKQHAGGAKAAPSLAPTMEKVPGRKTSHTGPPQHYPAPGLEKLASNVSSSGRDSAKALTHVIDWQIVKETVPEGTNYRIKGSTSNKMPVISSFLVTRITNRKVRVDDGHVYCFDGPCLSPSGHGTSWTTEMAKSLENGLPYHWKSLLDRVLSTAPQKESKIRKRGGASNCAASTPLPRSAKSKVRSSELRNVVHEPCDSVQASLLSKRPLRDSAMNDDSASGSAKEAQQELDATLPSQYPLPNDHKGKVGASELATMLERETSASAKGMRQPKQRKVRLSMPSLARREPLSQEEWWRGAEDAPELGKSGAGEAHTKGAERALPAKRKQRSVSVPNLAAVAEDQLSALATVNDEDRRKSPRRRRRIQRNESALAHGVSVLSDVVSNKPPGEIGKVIKVKAVDDLATSRDVAQCPIRSPLKQHKDVEHVNKAEKGIVCEVAEAALFSNHNQRTVAANMAEADDGGSEKLRTRPRRRTRAPIRYASGASSSSDEEDANNDGDYHDHGESAMVRGVADATSTPVSAAEPGEAWSEGDVAALRQARLSIHPHAPNFWTLVALQMPGRSPAECQTKYYEASSGANILTGTSNAPGRKRLTAREQVTRYIKARSTTDGTGNTASAPEHDIFQDSPFKKRLKAVKLPDGFEAVELESLEREAGGDTSDPDELVDMRADPGVTRRYISQLARIARKGDMGPRSRRRHGGNGEDMKAKKKKVALGMEVSKNSSSSSSAAHLGTLDVNESSGSDMEPPLPFGGDSDNLVSADEEEESDS
jgi:hypothetical protein